MTDQKFEFYSTSGMAAEKKLKHFNSVLDETLSGSVLDPIETVFGGQLRKWQLGDFNMIWPECSGSKIQRLPRQNYVPGPQKIFLGVMHQEFGRVSHRNDETELNTGDVILCASEDGYLLEFPRQHSMVILDFDRSILDERFANLDDIIGKNYYGSRVSTRILHSYLLTLWREKPSSLEPEAAQTYANALLDLILVMLNEKDDITSSLGTDSFERMRMIVNDRFADASLTPSKLADELGISLRHLQSLTASRMTTPGDFINKRRMHFAAEQLGSKPSCNITELAYRSGFNDSAYFSRRFREQFGVSPRCYRDKS